MKFRIVSLPLVSGLLALAVVDQATAASGVSVVPFSLEQPFEAPRWMYDKKVKFKGGPLVNLLVEAKKAQSAKERSACLAALQKAFALAKSLGPWLALNQLQCAQLADSKGAVSGDAMSAALSRIEAQPKWFYLGPSAAGLKTEYVKTLLALTDAQIKFDRRAAWRTLDKLAQVRTWLSQAERSQADRSAGELAFIEQNLLAAQDFLLRSLSEKENAEIRTRVNAIRATLLGEKKSDTDEKPVATLVGMGTTSPAPATKANDDLGVNEEERAIYARMKTAYDNLDYVAAIEDGVELLQKFPVSRRATESADRILDIYSSVSSRTEDKFRHVHETVVTDMLKADSGHLARWATSAYFHGHYADAQVLAERSFSKYAGHSDSLKMLALSAKAALARGHDSEAQEHFEKLLKEDSGTPAAVEATFHLGLMQFRARKYSDAAAYFERLLALSGSKDFEYRALYWQWRSLQRINDERSLLSAKTLIERYPLSYYGLRARAELNGGVLSLGNLPTPVKVEMRFLDTDRLAWERFSLLLHAGWFKEAEKELDSLPPPQSADEKVVRARLWALSMRYDLAVPLINKALDEDASLQQLSVLKVAFPKEFEAPIQHESQAVNVSADWIRSLLRQESVFRSDARSSSNALGLMQLLPPTGQEVARNLGVKNFQVPDSLLEPETNIKLGSRYLADMIQMFNGHVPLALAAYNAGPVRLKVWLQGRQDLAVVQGAPSSAPDSEIWIDELPWDETSFYVKSILRNWLIYRLLDGSKLKLDEPIWLDGKVTAR